MLPRQIGKPSAISRSHNPAISSPICSAVIPCSISHWIWLLISEPPNDRRRLWSEIGQMDGDDHRGCHINQ